jgi:hypothetical protein
VAGDLLVVASRADGAGAQSTPTGWTESINENSEDANNITFWKVADGSEGSTVEIPMVAGNPWIAGISWASRGLDFSTYTPDVSTIEVVTGSSAFINSPQVAMSHGQSTYDCYVVITSFGTAAAHATVDTDGYDELARVGVGTGDPWAALFHKRIEDVDVEDPAAFEFTTSSARNAHTIAILALGEATIPGIDHTHVEADVTDLDHWTEADHDALDHTGLTGVGGGGSVDDLTDATITGTPADNEVFAYDTGTSEWINQTAAEAGLAASSHTHTEADVTDLDHWTETDHDALDHTGLTGVGGADELDDLTDVVITTPSDGDIIRFDSGTGDWLNEPLPAAGAFDLDDADDVVITSVQDGDVVTWDSGTSKWINEAPSGGSGGQLTLLDTQTVSGSDAAIVHSSIPTGYDELLIVARIRSAGNTTQGDDSRWRCGAGTVDTAAASYSYGRVISVGSNAGNSDSSASAIQMRFGTIPSASHNDHDFAHCIVRVFDYDNADRDTVFQADITFALQDGSLWRHQMGFGSHRVGGAIDIIEIAGSATVSGTAGILEIGSTSRLFGRTYPT